MIQKRQIVLSIFLTAILFGCTPKQIEPTHSSSSFGKTYVDLSKENNKRPYIEGDTYYTTNAEVTLLSHEFITDGQGNPTLVVWLTYLNIGDTAYPPIGVRSSFHFFQQGKEIEEEFAYLSEDFSKQNPQFSSAYQSAITTLPSGEEKKIYLAIPLEDRSEVTLQLEGRSTADQPEKIIYVYEEKE